MHKRLNKQIATYLTTLKETVKEKAGDDSIPAAMKIENMLICLYDYPPLELTSQDLQKRQRAKNIVPHFERCTARRANGEQCTRRKKEDKNFCGTHIKGTPHGTITPNTQEEMLQTIEIWVQEIGGINYYIDANNNVYNPQDIYQNDKSPTIIHKWNCDHDGNYTLV